MTEGIVQDEKKKYREVQPIGYLHTHGNTFFLLNLKPIQPDWEELPERRFVGVPNTPFEYGRDYGKPEHQFTYSFARHVVTNSFAIEYNPNIKPILVWDLGNIDLSKIDLEPEDLEVEPDPVELMDILREVEETNG